MRTELKDFSIFRIQLNMFQKLEVEEGKGKDAQLLHLPGDAPALHLLACCPAHHYSVSTAYIQPRLSELMDSMDVLVQLVLQLTAVPLLHVCLAENP
jgi:hypothetical protein